MTCHEEQTHASLHPLQCPNLCYCEHANMPTEEAILFSFSLSSVFLLGSRKKISYIVCKVTKHKLEQEQIFRATS
jgi:hypothetical protein